MVSIDVLLLAPFMAILLSLLSCCNLSCLCIFPIPTSGNVSYLTVTYHPDEGMLASRGRGQPSKRLVPPANASPSPQEMYEARKLSTAQGERLILIFMFAHDEEIRLVKMHPEVFASDTTSGTTKNVLECATFAFLNGNKNAFQGARAFIPSGQKWVWNCLFVECLPMFWSPEVCSRVRLVVMDGDVCEYSGLTEAIIRKIFWLAMHILCYYHLFVQAWTKDIRPLIPKDSEESVKAASNVYYWIKSWFFYIESVQEFEVSRDEMYEYMQDNETILTANLVNEVKKLITYKLIPHKTKWINYHHMSVRGFNFKTTSPAEAMHSAMKTGFAAVKGTMSMAQSGKAMIAKTSKRNIKNASTMSKRKLWSDMDYCDWMTVHAEDRSQEFWNRKDIYCCVQTQHDKWLVFQSGKY